MLLEQLVIRAAQPPEYDWPAYYRWRFTGVDSREFAAAGLWLCRSCFFLNAIDPPARYRKCRGCGVIHLSAEAGHRIGGG